MTGLMSALISRPRSSVAGIACPRVGQFGFTDNLILLISDQVSVGQFHFSRSLFASVLVLLLAVCSNHRSGRSAGLCPVADSVYRHVDDALFQCSADDADR